ncbi:MAG: general stress protein [Lysinibacillus sp.]
METRNNRLYGIYNNEMELQTEMDRLRGQGYSEADMYIVASENLELSMYRGAASYVNDNREGSWWDRFKASLMAEDLVRDRYFKQMGFTDEERDRYYDEVLSGKYLLYVDKNFGAYFDGGMTNDEVPTARGLDDVSMGGERLVRPEEPGQVYGERRRPMNEEARNVEAAVHDGVAYTYERDGNINIPVTEARVDVTENDVVPGESVVGKRKASETVRREETDIQGRPYNGG